MLTMTNLPTWSSFCAHCQASIWLVCKTIARKMLFAVVGHTVDCFALMLSGAACWHGSSNYLMRFVSSDAFSLEQHCVKRQQCFFFIWSVVDVKIVGIKLLAGMATLRDEPLISNTKCDNMLKISWGLLCCHAKLQILPCYAQLVPWCWDFGLAAFW